MSRRIDSIEDIGWAEKIDQRKIYGNKGYYARKRQRKHDVNFFESLDTSNLAITQRLQCDERYNDVNGDAVGKVFGEFRPCHAIGREGFYSDEILEDSEISYDLHGNDNVRPPWVEIKDLDYEMFYRGMFPHQDDTELFGPELDEDWIPIHDDREAKRFPGEYRVDGDGHFWHFYGINGNGDSYRYGFHAFVVSSGGIRYHVGVRSNWHVLMNTHGTQVKFMPVWATEGGDRYNISGLVVPPEVKEKLKGIIDEACQRAERNPTELSSFDGMNLLTIPDIT
jgi:hypothetical protein